MDGVHHLPAALGADQHGRPVNLIAPPVRRFLAWSLRRPAQAAAYFLATFQLSRLTVTLRCRGRVKKIVVTYSGRGAEVRLPLDSLLAP